MATLISILLRVVFAIGAIVVTLALLAVGIFTAIALLLWSLLRGRKPVFKTVNIRRPGATRAPQGEVVDVEAREVPDDHQRLADSSSRISP
ncbi:MAG TPA: hypothetical protein VGE47_00810 [Burkholderiaceae bacterium]